MLNEEQEKISFNKEKEINRELLDIGRTLKTISNINTDYIEYMSALIYVIYENREDFKNILKNGIENMNDILQEIDNILYFIRTKEESERLFINLRFTETINREDYIIFKEVLDRLSKLIIKIENLVDNSKKILAQAFEYIIMIAAQNNEISIKNGEFYTPQIIVQTMVKLLDIKPNMAIYNPACGTGNFITESAKCCSEIFAFGEETDISKYNICITNLWLHDIYNTRIKEHSEEPIQIIDLAIGNPPFVDNKSYVETNGKIDRIYYKYGISSKSSSYIRYLSIMIESIHKKGKMAIILPHGFLFKKTKVDYYLRRDLIKKQFIDSIIALPEKLFYNTKIPVVIVIIDKAKIGGEILFIDSSKEYRSERKMNFLSVENQNKILQTYRNRKEIINYSYIAKLEEIEENDYDLDIKKYVKIKNKVEDINQEELEEKVYRLEQKRKRVQDQIHELIIQEKY